jgi:ubiquitin C-terminal hydrolase
MAMYIYSYLCCFSGPHHGHYVAIIKSNGQWMLFDDDVVTVSVSMIII